MEYIIGIDPGVSGGCAVLRMDGKVEEAIKFKDQTPTDLSHGFKVYKNSRVYIEKLHSILPAGKTPNFNLGKSYGMLLGFVYAFDYKINHVQPLKWQTYLGCRSKGDKNVTKRKAQELFPGLTITHAIADALLIAEYGRRQELLLQRTDTVADL